MKKYKLSIICATYGNDKYHLISNLINSIVTNISDKFDIEFILVDQNKNSNYKSLISNKLNYTNISYKYLRSEVGLSKSRNVGLKQATGQLVCFPDDDCVYPSGMLDRIIDFFSENPKIDMLITKVRDLDNLYDLRFTNKKNNGILTPNEVFTNCCSISIFHKLENKKILFDTNFGLGSIYKSCEDYDYVLTCINNDETVYFNTNLYVQHPDSNIESEEYVITKIKQNAIGHGSLFNKHFRMIKRTTFMNFIKPMLGIIFASLLLNKFKLLQYYYLLKYRTLGFIKYEKTNKKIL